MKRIMLCADDYGQNPAISQAIIALAEQNRLSATSCLVNSFYWTVQAKWLLPFKEKMLLGLHLNFTTGKALSRAFIDCYGEDFFSLPTLLLKTQFRTLKTDILEQEIHAQIDRFIEGIGFLPAYIDGHQHVLHFPQIREAFLKVYAMRLQKNHTYVRHVFAKNIFFTKNFLKKLIIRMTGAKKFLAMLEANAIPHNTSFSGIYAFTPTHYEKYFATFLDEVTDGGLIMCHPGLPGGSDHDAIAAARAVEYAFFASDIFPTLCKQKSVIIQPNAS